MRTFQCQSHRAQRGAACSLYSLSNSIMSPLSLVSVTIAALLLLNIPVCKSKLNTTLLFFFFHIDAVCSSYLSADMKFSASDALGELCVLMLVQKMKELKTRENSKRTPVLHPLLHLVSQLHTRRERGLSMSAELQGPGGVQSRGYFLYRPRNGRRSLEYE
uniref:Neuromedin U n=1 Tax=Sphaeramia orbicularis TaxID=375764 RepID=A0A673B0E5_9TELE